MITKRKLTEREKKRKAKRMAKNATKRAMKQMDEGIYNIFKAGWNVKVKIEDEDEQNH